MVTTIGVDPHKATHTAVPIDETEQVVGELTVPDHPQTYTPAGSPGPNQPAQNNHLMG